MLRLFFSLTVALALNAAAHAQTAPKLKDAGQVHTLLYVGNCFFCFNDRMPSIVLRLVAACDPPNRPKYRSTSLRLSCCGVNWHGLWALLKPGGGIAAYSLPAEKKLNLNRFDKALDA